MGCVFSDRRALGIETADRGSFFSSTDNTGFGYRVVSQVFSTVGKKQTSECEIEMHEGHWRIAATIEFRDHKLVRTQKLTCIKDSVFQDFVMRFRVPKHDFPFAYINNIGLVHESRNYWTQFPVNYVKLLSEVHKLSIRTTSWHGSRKFRLDSYVRDEPGDYWIVHVRLMPDPPDEFWIRWDTRWGRLIDLRDPFAGWLLRRKSVRRCLWYRAERKGGRPNVQGQGISILPAGSDLEITVECLLQGLEDSDMVALT